MSEINTYNHLTVYGVEKWINDRMEYLKKEVRKYHDFKDLAHMDTHTLHRFSRKITELEVLKDMKSELHSLDSMYECNIISDGRNFAGIAKYFTAPPEESK